MNIWMWAHSSTHTGGVSEHLRSSSPRVRFLGMALSVIVSELADKPENQIKFDFSTHEEDELRNLRLLVAIEDRPLSLAKAAQVFENRRRLNRQTEGEASMKISTGAGQPKKSKTESKPASKPMISVIEEYREGKSRIQELDDEDADEDDLLPLKKPAFDPEDSDEDATLVSRNKPKAPV